MHLLLPVLDTGQIIEIIVRFIQHLIASQGHLQTCKLGSGDMLILAALFGECISLEQSCPEFALWLFAKQTELEEDPGKFSELLKKKQPHHLSGIHYISWSCSYCKKSLNPQYFSHCHPGCAHFSEHVFLARSPGFIPWCKSNIKFFYIPNIIFLP